ncbi:hypothetical protein ACLB2K_002101 [Fragaria x ananassa]
MTAKLSFLALFLLVGAVSQFVAAKPLSQSKLQSPLLQESIIKEINENPEAGWQAAMSPRFSNYTVGDFMHILGVKQIPKKELLGVPVVSHPKTLKLPNSFDAREAWSQCNTIGKILGWVTVALAGLLLLLKHYQIVSASNLGRTHLCRLMIS